LDVYQPRVQNLLPGATSVSFSPRNVYNVDRAFTRLRKDVETIAGRQLRDYRQDESKMPSGWMGIRVQCYTWKQPKVSETPVPQPTMVHRWSPTLHHPGGTLPVLDLDRTRPISRPTEAPKFHMGCSRGSPLADIRIITGSSNQDVRVEVYGNNEFAVGALKAHIEGVSGAILSPDVITSSSPARS